MASFINLANPTRDRAEAALQQLRATYPNLTQAEEDAVRAFYAGETNVLRLRGNVVEVRFVAGSGPNPPKAGS